AKSRRKYVARPTARGCIPVILRTLRWWNFMKGSLLVQQRRSFLTCEHLLARLLEILSG
ncbi:hypothetical protein PIB30_096443, partial [Stylosanthes scabra]|nr:hypothetical protein [Stylosanthes scabra]